MAVISLLYQSELLEEQINVGQIFQDHPELDSEQIKMFKFIAKNYSLLQKLIAAHLNSQWQWERILPLNRAILLYGISELFFSEHRIVINEMIEISKEFTADGDKDYGFINAVIENVYQYLKRKKIIYEPENKN
ncbi:transcription antitermination factor NusB [Mesomycoplasma conjunctivae]|uniref:transcription antitermination factor NusB n=1 Tax=Mesomycoplasma conjunctivae TaxID=45361 RepID=UPI003DA3C7EE